jgi:hypothetical protein
MKIKVNHSLTSYSLTPQSRFLLEKLTVAQPLKKFPALMELENLLLCSEDPATGPYPVPDESNPNTLSYFSKRFLLLSSNLNLDLPNNLFLLGFPTEISMHENES